MVPVWFRFVMEPDVVCTMEDSVHVGLAINASKLHHRLRSCHLKFLYLITTIDGELTESKEYIWKTVTIPLKQCDGEEYKEGHYEGILDISFNTSKSKKQKAQREIPSTLTGLAFKVEHFVALEIKFKHTQPLLARWPILVGNEIDETNFSSPLSPILHYSEVQEETNITIPTNTRSKRKSIPIENTHLSIML